MTPPDLSIEELRRNVREWVGEVSARRTRKAERIVRHLARLTLHHLAPAPLSTPAESILATWQRDCAKLTASLDTSSGAAAVIRALLLRFAQSMSDMRDGRAATSRPLAFPEKRPRANGTRVSPAERRYVKLIGADLTALLRINLAQWGLRDTARRADYAAARSILMPLAKLDAVFDTVGQQLAVAPGQAGNVPRDRLRAGP